MQKRNREVNVFSLSAIDLFCSGMGAIMVLTVILMPYYLRPESSEMMRQIAAADARARAATEASAKLEAQVESAEARARAAAEASAKLEGQVESAEARARAATEANAKLEGQVESLERTNAAIQSKLENPFLCVAISWSSDGDDLDLHVTDPKGRLFYFGDTTHPGSEAKLEVDSVKGPGNEVWIHPVAEVGDYKIECVFFRDGGDPGPVEVRGVVVHRDGRYELKMVRMPAPNTSKVLMATLTVSADGEVTLR